MSMRRKIRDVPSGDGRVSRGMEVGAGIAAIGLDGRRVNGEVPISGIGTVIESVDKAGPCGQGEEEEQRK